LSTKNLLFPVIAFGVGLFFPGHAAGYTVPSDQLIAIPQQPVACLPLLFRPVTLRPDLSLGLYNLYVFKLLLGFSDIALQIRILV
jgi:hypothetical protein